MYGKRENERLSVITVFGAVGDFHEMTPTRSFHPGRSGRASPRAGRRQGLVRRPRPPRRQPAVPVVRRDRQPAAHRLHLGDKGSFGTVVSPDSGAGHEAAADLTRAVREAVLHQGTPADSV
ncbi:hypothetical protein E4K10_24625 [Streptomyces sp. T1317-0309]|nr:hypothetical protein E4K10_24625 [Streptomyces sp. T1317-0309]